jgi:triacylglycerol lipase
MFPIVLVHGIARFDIVAEIIRRTNPIPLNLFERFQYFNGIVPYLIQNGFDKVFAPNLDFAGPSALRALQLGTAIDFYLGQKNAKKVHIIAHSMGGLDARRLIVDSRYAGKVASLTTIGTPHLGTVLADQVIAFGGGDLLHNIRRFINLDLDGALDLTVARCSEFNQRFVDVEASNDVFYQTYSSFEPEDRIFGPMLPFYKYLFENAGANDGFVPVDSQTWVDKLQAANGLTKMVAQKEFPIPADHLNQTGWWDWEERDGTLELANPFAEKQEYETQVKAIYLEIATGVQGI